ncbi:TPA: oligosaccharide flippase family protein [Photobacterium damselae]
MKNKIIINSLWLLIDKGVILIGGIITTLIVASYLNPEDMGKINYGIMLAAICSVFSQWGAGFSIFESSSSEKENAEWMVKDTFTFRIIVYIFCWVLFSIYLFSINDFNDALFISLICLSSIFLSLDIYQYYFDGTLNSSFNTKATFIGRLLSIISRLFIVYFQFNLWCFLIPFILEGVFIYFLKRKYFYAITLTYNKNKTKKYVKKFYRIGLAITIYGALTLLYDKINVFLINKLLSFYDVGVFTMTKTLSMAWTFLPLSFGTSIITKELSNKKGNYLAITYIVLFFISCPIVFFLFFFSKEMILIILGEKYLEVAIYLPWLSVLSIFSCMTLLTNRVIFSLPNGKNKLLIKSMILAIIGVFSSYFCIVIYGLYGAILSASIVLFFDLFIINIIFYPKYFMSVFYNIFHIPFEMIKIRCKR